MRIYGQKSNWPCLAILLCLFALSVTAPRHWRNFVSKKAGKNHSRLDSADHRASAAKTSPDRVAGPAATPAAMPRATPEVSKVVARALDPPHPSSGPAARPNVQKVETAAQPTALVKSSPAEPAMYWPTGPRLVSATDKITHLQTVDPLPRSDHSPVNQPLLAQPPVAHDPGGVVPPQISTRLWLPPSATLIEQLENIDINGACSLWAYETIDLLEQLATLEADDRETIDITLESLRRVAAQADRAIEQVDDPDGASQLRHARYALLRRLDLWQGAAKIDLAAGEPGRPSPLEVRRNISQSVSEVSRAARRTIIATSWRRYLMLDALRSLASEPGDAHLARRRQVARRVLSRTESPGLTSEQRAFVDSPPVESLKTHLHHWASEDVDVAALLAKVERFERDRSSVGARLVAQEYQRIRWSPSPAERDLAERVEAHYRNANVRLAVTDRLLNLMLPPVEPKLGTIDDNILGNTVRGRKYWTTKLRTRFLPSHRRLRFSLEAHGEVHSRTTASTSKATLYNRGLSRYRAGKLIQVGPRGVRMWPAVAESRSESELEDVETSYDRMPLIGSFAKSYARDQHEQMQAEAMQQVDRKVRREAIQQLDAEVHRQIKKFKTAFASHILDPLTHLSLKPHPIQLLTTKNRMVSRVRLATADQLAAFTPRPRAPGDSLLSLQVHESAPGNIIEQLDLDGRTFTLRELYRWVREKTGRTQRPMLADEEELPEDVAITFADHNAAQIRFEDGHVEVTLNVKQLTTPGRRMKNFTVKASYEPGGEGIDATLVRRDAVSLKGRKKINMRGQIVLRGIFGKVFSKNRPIHLLGPQIASRPGLENVTVTQMVVRNGWIGVAIGPRRESHHKPRPAGAKNVAKNGARNAP